MAPTEQARRTGRLARWRPWLFAFLLIAGLVAVVLNFGELENFGLLVRRAQPFWLIAALALQVTTYVSVALGWWVVLKAGGAPRRLWTLIPISISKLFADQAVPTAGMSGNLLLVDRLTGIGVPRGTAVTALLLSIVGYYSAYALFALAVLVLLWLHRDATPLLAGSITIFLLIAFGIPALALRLARRGPSTLPGRLRDWKPLRQLTEITGMAPADLVHDRALIAKAAFCNGLVFLADAATLQVSLLALGQPVPFNTALIALIMASIAVTLAPVPLGLGSFEAVCVAMLRLLGVPFEAAVAGTLLLRGFTLWLPLVPGMLLTRRIMRRKAPARGTESPATP